MANLTYKVAATVTTGALDVFLSINSNTVTLTRNSGGSWTGNANLSLPSPVPLEFKAVGITSTTWNLSIKFTPVGGKAKTYSNNGTIPADMLSDLQDTFTL
jgi:hypothetical protein